MSLTIRRIPQTEFEGGRVRGAAFDITFGSSYPSGGEPITARNFGFLSIAGMHMVGGNAASGRYLFQYDTANKKLMVFYPSGGGAASPAALADPAIASGAVAVTSTAANGSSDLVPGRAKELLNTTDASTLTIRVMVWANG